MLKGKINLIDLERGEIILGEKKVKIKKFEVWWNSPMGLHTSFDDAKDQMRTQELPINMIVKPVPVAIAEDGTYECII